MAIGRRILKIGLPVLACAIAAQASSILYVTPTGSTTSGGSVSASALFTPGDGTVTIVLSDLQANPTDVAQLISDISFTLSNGATSGSITSSTGTEINIASHIGTVGSVVSPITGWSLSGLHLTALGGGEPTHLIIGPGPYTNANGSINGNGPHNPFINGSATFVLAVAGVTADTTVTSAVFSFGTTAGIDVTGCVGTAGVAGCNSSTVPEPTTLSLMGAGLLGLGFIRRRIGK